VNIICVAVMMMMVVAQGCGTRPDLFLLLGGKAADKPLVTRRSHIRQRHVLLHPFLPKLPAQW
jgi:hypothetical protein